MSQNSTKTLSKSQGWFGAKRMYKRTFPRIPFYNFALGALRPFAERFDWIRRIPVAKTAVEVAVSGKSVLLQNTHRCEIAKRLWWTSGELGAEEEEFSLCVFEFACEEAQIALDIGCNTGLFSLVAAVKNSHLQVWSFDLVPEAVTLATENVLANNLADQIFPLLLGVGKPGRMRVPTALDTSSVPSSLSTDFSFEYGANVRIISLDSLRTHVPNGATVVIKIDVEATEHNIFAHGVDFLAEHLPDIVCELLVRSRVGDFQEALAKLGYKFFQIGPDGIHLKQHLEPHKKYRDWLFTTRPDHYRKFIPE